MFTNSKGEKLTARQIYNIVSRAGQQAGTRILIRNTKTSLVICKDTAWPGSGRSKTDPQRAYPRSWGILQLRPRWTNTALKI